jgi:hypothetical protein
MSLPIVTADIRCSPLAENFEDQAVRRRLRTSTAPTPIAATPMSAISSMSAPVKASPLGEVVTPALDGVAGPLPDEVVMPVAGDVQPE